MSASGRYFILEGHTPRSVPLMTWMQWFETSDKERVVADIRLSGPTPVRVSTVFLGLDHNWTGRGRPLLFETMIFGGEFDGQQWRCSTWDDALWQHQAALCQVLVGGEHGIAH